MISKDPGCLRDMLWRISFDDLEAKGVGARLLAAGWTNRARMPVLLDLEGPQGHVLVIVPRTGRMQLRLHYLTAHEDRPSTAQRLHDEIEQLARA